MPVRETIVSNPIYLENISCKFHGMISDRPLLIHGVIEFKNYFAVEGVNIVEMITTINKPIKTLHLEIKKAISEDTGGHFYGLVCIF